MRVFAEVMRGVEYIQVMGMCKLQNRKGAAMIEYAILIAGVAALVLATVFSLGGGIDSTMNGVLTEMQSQ
jgi:Flp pilus assembly pilin Flp